MTPLQTSPLFTGTIPLWGRTIKYLVPASAMSEKSAEAQHAIWASITDLPRNDWCDPKLESDSEWQSFPESFAQSSQSSPEKDVVIAVMGVTGAGKSTFIKTVSERNDVVVGDSLSSGSSTSPSQC